MSIAIDNLVSRSIVIHPFLTSTNEAVIIFGYST